MRTVHLGNMSARLFFAFLGFPLLIAACGARSALDDTALALDGPGSIDGGADAPADADVVPPLRNDAGRIVSCGRNLPGPQLVIHKDYFGNAMCIDATEVTNDQYAEFLASAPDVTRDSPCASKQSYRPTQWPARAGRGAHPVVGVDWCDARAFCAWSGKSLCRHNGPDALNPAFAGDPQLDEWAAACGGNRAASYAYGADYNGNACNGRDYGLGDTSPVTAPASCQGADRAVYGLSGNVWEWEDACADGVGEDGECLARGGSFRSDRIELRCDGARPLVRTATADDVGFRCCVD